MECSNEMCGQRSFTSNIHGTDRDGKLQIDLLHSESTSNGNKTAKLKAIKSVKMWEIELQKCNEHADFSIQQQEGNLI